MRMPRHPEHGSVSLLRVTVAHCFHFRTRPTTIRGVNYRYQAVIHCEIVRQAARVVAMDRERLRSGDRKFLMPLAAFSEVLLISLHAILKYTGLTANKGKKSHVDVSYAFCRCMCALPVLAAP